MLWQRSYDPGHPAAWEGELVGPVPALAPGAATLTGVEAALDLWRRSHDPTDPMGWPDVPQASRHFNPDEPRDPHSGKWMGGGGAAEKVAEALGKALGGQDALGAAPATLKPGPKGHHGDYTGEELTGPHGMGSARALSEYEGVEYQVTNQFLRGGYRLTEEEKNGKLPDFLAGTPERIEQIDKTMAVSRLTADVQVHRAVMEGRLVFGDAWYGNVIDWHTRDVDAQDRQIEEWEAGARPDLTGLQWREDAYVSTTADEAVVKEFGGRWPAGNSPLDGEPIIMTIRVPRGVGAVQMSDLAKGQEAELLLQRRLTMRVVADHGVDADGFRRLDVSAVPSD